MSDVLINRDILAKTIDCNTDAGIDEANQIITTALVATEAKQKSKQRLLHTVAIKTQFLLAAMNSDNADALDTLELIEEVEEALRAAGYLE